MKFKTITVSAVLATVIAVSGCSNTTNQVIAKEVKAENVRIVPFTTADAYGQPDTSKVEETESPEDEETPEVTAVPLLNDITDVGGPTEVKFTELELLSKDEAVPEVTAVPLSNDITDVGGPTEVKITKLELPKDENNEENKISVVKLVQLDQHKSCCDIDETDYEFAIHVGEWSNTSSQVSYIVRGLEEDQTVETSWQKHSFRREKWGAPLEIGTLNIPENSKRVEMLTFKITDLDGSVVREENISIDLKKLESIGSYIPYHVSFELWEFHGSAEVEIEKMGEDNYAVYGMLNGYTIECNYQIFIYKYMEKNLAYFSVKRPSESFDEPVEISVYDKDGNLVKKEVF